MARNGKVVHFVQTVEIQTEVKVMTSGGECKFWNPIDKVACFNDLKAQWCKIPVGSKVHLISWSETPDQATCLIEIDHDGTTTRVGTLFRKASWEKILAAGEKPEVVPAQEAQGEAASEESKASE